ncbi:MAG: Intermediate filament protein [Phylliscum demangeonii]|nr:MAG: Intermediate filament protein [Phylliscum demangeonii]
MVLNARTLLPVLRFIGYAFIAGALLSLVALCSAFLLSVQRVEYHSAAPERKSALLAFARPEAWAEEVAALAKRSQYVSDSIYPESSEISKSLESLLELIQRDFIKPWYSTISSNPSFTNEIDKILRAALIDLRDRISGLDLVQTVVARVVPIITDHLREFDRAERLVRGRRVERHVSEAQDLDLAIANKFRDGKLHPAIVQSLPESASSQLHHLRGLMAKVLAGLLPPGQGQSRAILVLVQEILACAIAYPIMQLCTDSDSWNQLIEAYQCNNLSDAQRLRSEITTQLKRSSKAGSQDSVYVRRLGVARQLLDQRISQLVAGRSSSWKQAQGSNATSFGKPEERSLVDILRNSTGLPYFMEFMDRQGLIDLVQFWLVVERLRNPLEDNLLEEEKARFGATSWSESDRIDLLRICEVYLPRLELDVNRESREAIDAFLKSGVDASLSQYQTARQTTFRIQAQVLEKMQNEQFLKFQHSDLFVQYWGSDHPFDGQGSAATFMAQRAPERPQSVMSRVLSMTDVKKEVFKRAATSSFEARLTMGSENNARGQLEGPLLGPQEEEDEDPLSLSINSLDSDLESTTGQGMPDSQIVEAMQEALDDIIQDKPVGRGGRFVLQDSPKFGSGLVEDGDSTPSSMDLPQPHSTGPPANEKPSIASLGLVNPSSRIGVFTDDDLFPDEEKFLEDEHDDPDESTPEEAVEETVQEAAPGDLGLTEAVSALTAEIEKLSAQNAVVHSLTLKAELTNNTAELRILRKSRTSLEREIRRRELQRQQYILQESDNHLYGRATINIKSVMVDVIEVTRHAGSRMAAAVWAVVRRYSEFHDLHQRLRSQYPSVRHLDFPRRRVMMKLQRDFLHKRRLALEKYLQVRLRWSAIPFVPRSLTIFQGLLLLPEVCRSRELRAFLSQQANSAPDASSSVSPSSGPPNPNEPQELPPRDMMSRLYDSLSTGVDDILGTIPVLDQLSVAGQNLIGAATQQLQSTYSSAAPAAGGGDDAVRAVAEAEAEVNAFENGSATSTRPATNQDARSPATTTDQPPFVKPICDIFLELFNLNQHGPDERLHRSNSRKRPPSNWQVVLRGRAVVILLHQLLGGTIERKIREAARRMLYAEDAIVHMLGLVRDAVWPGGSLRPQPAPLRTAAGKARSRTEAGLVLAALLPDVVSSVVGRANAQQAARKVEAALNHRLLTSHLMYTILDEVVDVLFPDGAAPRTRPLLR